LKLKETEEWRQSVVRNRKGSRGCLHWELDEVEWRFQSFEPVYQNLAFFFAGSILLPCFIPRSVNPNCLELTCPSSLACISSLLSLYPLKKSPQAFLIAFCCCGSFCGYTYSHNSPGGYAFSPWFGVARRCQRIFCVLLWTQHQALHLENLRYR
jgi:hypothetical protein